MRILALTKYGPRAASTRQRFLQYVEPLRSSGIELTVSPLLDDRHVAALEDGRRSSPLYVASRYVRRLGALISATKYDLLWVHCELFPYLPGWFERMGIQIGKRPIVFDYDDAIFHMYDAHRYGFVRSFLGRKLEPLLQRAAGATCGNAYLRDYAAQFCGRSIILPTVVDTRIYRPVERDPSQRLTVGWIGSPSTWKNVRAILPVLQNLCATHDVLFRAVGAGAASAGDQFAEMERIAWSEATEVAEVQHFDIGIMPLIDAPFERGKSGYKLVQYMACGLPSVGSPVGVNETILDEGCGLLASTSSQWKDALERLVLDDRLRSQIGAAARRRAVEKYSLEAHAPRLAEFFLNTAV